MNMIMLGAPGTGKGTQAEIIAKKYNIPTISTGAMLRAAIREGTEFGKMAKELIDAGKLVGDDVIIGMISERLKNPDCANGFILDGFPRTIAQADALEELGVKIDLALSFELADEVIIKRLAGRRECPKCRATFHIENKPSAEGDKCDQCHAELITRDDDKPETIKNRLKVYYEQSEPLKGYYDKKGVLKQVNADDTLDNITKNVFEIIEAL